MDKGYIQIIKSIWEKFKELDRIDECCYQIYSMPMFRFRFSKNDILDIIKKIKKGEL